MTRDERIQAIERMRYWYMGKAKEMGWPRSKKIQDWFLKKIRSFGSPEDERGYGTDQGRST